MGRYPSGQRGQTVNLLASAFGGSNPSLPTVFAHIAQSEERILGKNEVRSANLRVGSEIKSNKIYGKEEKTNY